MNVFEWLIVVSLSLLAADRIDLSGGRGDFLVTPNLVLLPLVALAHVRSLVVRKHLATYCVCMAVILMIAFSSAVRSPTPDVTLRRSVLFSIITTTTLCAAIILRKHPRRDKIAASAAYLGIVVFLTFNLIQVVLSSQGVFKTDIKSDTYFDFKPWGFGMSGVPRFSGFSADPNRGGFALIFFIGLLLNHGRSGFLRASAIFVALFQVFLTASRSSFLALIAMGIAMFVGSDRKFAFGKEVRLISLYSVVAFGCALLAFGNGIVELAYAQFNTVIDERLSVSSEYSGGIHLELLKRGVEVGTESVPNFLLGSGFGSSFATLGDIFPDNAYGNYHSLYISFLAETGGISLALLLYVLCTPVFRQAKYGELICAAIIFNVFYQTTMESSLWMLLALSWASLDVKRERDSPALLGLIVNPQPNMHPS